MSHRSQADRANFSQLNNITHYGNNMWKRNGDQESKDYLVYLARNP